MISSLPNTRKVISETAAEMKHGVIERDLPANSGYGMPNSESKELLIEKEGEREGERRVGALLFSVRDPPD